MRKIILISILWGIVLFIPKVNAQASDEGKVFAEEVLTFFYPDNPPGDINDSLEKLAQNMLEQAMEGSNQFDKVPRPSGFKPGIGWLAKQVVQVAYREAKDQGIYEAIRVTVALKNKSAYEMAKLGIDP